MNMFDQMNERKRQVQAAVGKTLHRKKDQVPYLLESFDERSGECVLIPKGKGRKTRKWYANLLIDYAVAEEPQA